MKKPDRITAIFGAIVLAAVVVVGTFSALASGGDQSDPLVTLSYLTQVLTPELLAEVDDQISASEQELTNQFNSAMSDYTGQIEQALSQGSAESTAYVPVSLAQGKTLYPAAGSELLLRSGQAKVSAGSSPALLDTTAGSSLETGGSLVTNHLYVVPLDGVGVTAASACVVLVRGSYTIG